MENPVEEIVPLGKRLTSTTTPEQQKDLLERYVLAARMARVTSELNEAELLFYRYFTQDVGFRHPLCYVPPGPNSRDALVGIYSHARALSPNTVAETRVVGAYTVF